MECIIYSRCYFTKYVDVCVCVDTSKSLRCKMNFLLRYS